MLAKDLMRREVVTVKDDASLEDLVELVIREHIHGVPVLDAREDLVGIVTQQDIFFSSVTRAGAKPGDATGEGGDGLRVRDVMTSPAVSAAEDTDVAALCRMMHRLRIHRVPIVRDGKVTGIVSSLDVCRAVAEGSA